MIKMFGLCCLSFASDNGLSTLILLHLLTYYIILCAVCWLLGIGLDATRISANGLFFSSRF